MGTRDMGTGDMRTETEWTSFIPDSGSDPLGPGKAAPKCTEEGCDWQGDYFRTLRDVELARHQHRMEHAVAP